MLEVNGHRIIVLLDRSGSMDTTDCDGQSRFEYCREKLKAFVPEAIKSAAGGEVTCFLFNNLTRRYRLTSDADIDTAMNASRPGGGTGTHLALEQAFELATPEVPTMVFLVTDGRPDSEQAVDKEIISITQRIKMPEDFRIMILTVGLRDEHINAWLAHLDADLGPAGAAFDIVGQNNLQEVTFQEAAAELIASTTTNTEADTARTAGIAVAGKMTGRID